jgi:hypothetical protein
MNTLESGPRKRSVRTLSVFCLVIFVMLAGCVGAFAGPYNQKGPVGLNVTNAANTTHTFEVFVVDLPANLTIKNVNKGTYTDDVGTAGISTTKLDSYNNTVTAIEPPDTARFHGRYTLNTGKTVLSNVTDFRDKSVVVVIISHDGIVASLVTSQCDGDLVAVRVGMYYYGSSSAYDCDEGVLPLSL